VQGVVGVLVVGHAREEYVQWKDGAMGAVAEAEVASGVEGVSVDFDVEVAGDGGAEAGVVGYVEAFPEEGQAADAHDEGVDVKGPTDAAGWERRRGGTSSQVEPEGLVAAGEVFLPRQRGILWAVGQVRFRVAAKGIRHGGRFVGAAEGLVGPFLGGIAAFGGEVVTERLQRETVLERRGLGLAGVRTGRVASLLPANFVAAQIFIKPIPPAHCHWLPQCCDWLHANVLFLGAF